MVYLPYNATREEWEELRQPKTKPHPSTAPIIRPGMPPIFRNHGPVLQARHSVYVIRGRWVLVCCFCPGIQHLGHPAPSAFDQYGRPVERWACELCSNSAAGQRIADVIWPEPRYARDIYQVLNARPDPETRNWVPGETIGDLLAENVTNGVA